MKKAMLLSCFVGIWSLLIVQSASADLIVGSANATRYKGTDAKVVLHLPNGSTQTTEDSHLASSTVTVEHFVPSNPDGTIPEWGAYSTVAPYHFEGANGTRGVAIHAGGYFRDEIYFATSNGWPGYLEFDFDVSYLLLTVRQGSFSQFRMELSYGDTLLDSYQDSLTNFGNPDPYDLDPYLLDTNFDGVVGLSTLGAGDLLAGTGGFFPLTFSLWTDTTDAFASWNVSRQFQFSDLQGFLKEVRVYQPTGSTAGPAFRQLNSSDRYTLYSSNGYSLEPVPEPASLLLLGTGLVGLWARRKRQE